MADETVSDESQTDESQTSTRSQADPRANGSQTDADETMTLSEARKLRREAANNRKKMADLEAEVRQHRDADLPELDRYKKRVQELEEQQAQAVLDRKSLAVERLLSGAQYPNLLLREVDLSDVELDTTGKVRQGDKLVNRLKTDYPLLWNAGNADGGAAGDASGTFDMNALIRRRMNRR